MYKQATELMLNFKDRILIKGKKIPASQPPD